MNALNTALRQAGLRLTAVAVWTALSNPAFAATRTWTVGASTWNSAANWGGVVPTVGDTAVINNGGKAGVESGSTANYGDLYLGKSPGGQGSLSVHLLSIVNGTRTYVGYADSELSVSGTMFTSDLYLGFSGTGNLSIAGYAGNVGAGDDIYATLNSLNNQIGQNGLGIASVGENGIWTAHSLAIGSSGTGYLTIYDNGYVSGAAYIGDFGGKGSATVQDSGTWETGSGLVVGSDTGTGTLQIHAGYVSGTTSRVGFFDGRGTVTVNGGTWANSSQLFIGDSGTGTLSINGGLVTSGTTFLAMRDAPSRGSQGSLTLSGGVFATAKVVEGEGTGTFLLNGGTLQARANESDFLSGFEPGDVATTGGGAIIDSNGYNIGIAASVIGDGRLRKIGGGILTMTGSNSYSGGTTVKSGTLVLSSGGSITHTGATTFVGAEAGGDQGALVLNGGNLQTGDIYFGSGTGSFGGGTITSGTLFGSTDFYAGHNSGTGAISVNGGYVSNLNGYVGVNSGTGSLNVSSGTWVTRQVLTIGSTNSSGSLQVQGGLVSAQTTDIGYLQNASASAVITGGTLASTSGIYVGVGGTGSLQINGGLVSSNKSSIGSVFEGMRGAGSATITSGTWANTGELSVGVGGSGTLLINGGKVISDSALIGTGTATMNGGEWNSRILIMAYEGSLFLNSGSLSTALGAIGYQGTGNVEVKGGTWANSADLYVGYLGSGTVSIRSGSVSAGAVTMGFLSGMGAMTVSGSNGQRAVLSTGRIVEDDSGSGTITIDGGIIQARADESAFLFGFEAGDVTITTADAFIDTNGHAIGISSPLGGAGSLVKLGQGTLTLSGSNSYTGDTVIDEGTVFINGDNSANGRIFVNDHGTLGGSGKVGDVRVTDLATLAPGNSPGLLTIEGDLTMEAESTLVMEFTGTANGAFDQLAVAGLFEAPGIILDLDVSYDAQWGDSFLIFTGELPNLGNFILDTNLDGGLSWDLSQLSSAGIVTIVPEPATSLLVIASLGVFACRNRRRN